MGVWNAMMKELRTRARKTTQLGGPVWVLDPALVPKRLMRIGSCEFTTKTLKTLKNKNKKSS